MWLGKYFCLSNVHAVVCTYTMQKESIYTNIRKTENKHFPFSDFHFHFLDSNNIKGLYL